MKKIYKEKKQAIKSQLHRNIKDGDYTFLYLLLLYIYYVF